MPQSGERISVASARVVEIRRRRDGGWCACIVEVEQGPVDMLGHHLAAAGLLPNAEEGRFFSLDLSFQPHPTFGPQWRIERAVPTTPLTPTGLVAYLEQSIPGIGPRRAASLVNRFGADLIQVLDAPDAIQRIHDRCRIRIAVVEHLVTAWKEAKDDRRLSLTLLDSGWTMGQVARARECFGAAIGNVLATDPYRLIAVRGIGFRLADSVAMRIGIAADHPSRLIAAIAHILTGEAEDGHCWMAFDGVVVRAAELLVQDGMMLRTRLDTVLVVGGPDADAVVVRDLNGRCWLRRLWLAHRVVVHGAARRIATLREMGAAYQGLGSMDALALTSEQLAAVDGVTGHTLVVLTGGPGTGKTTVVRAIINACSERMRSPLIRLAAPTGKAARRLSESTSRDAVTIHRLLDWTDKGPRRTVGNPVEADVVIIDEASMLDLELAAALLDALPTACRLVLVGDVDQLPSVGPGQVLADLIAGGVPTYRLTIVHRQAQGSAILRAAHAVNRGDMPVSGSDHAIDDLFFIRQPEEGLLVDRVVRMVAETITAQRGIPPEDIRVLVPMNGGACGVDAVNRRLRDRLNPAGTDKAEIGTGEDRLRVGDRLVWLSNSTEHGLVNGEELVLEGVEMDAKGQQATLRTEAGRLLRMPVPSLDVRLAYAFTIHKSQGSEYPAVVIVLHRSAWRMLERRLLYTAITRAKKLCLLVGDQRALARAVGNLDSQGRRSGLAEDVVAAIASGDGRLP